MWTVFKVFIEFVNNIAPIVYVFFYWPQGMWDLRCPTRGRTCAPALEGNNKLPS